MFRPSLVALLLLLCTLAPTTLHAQNDVLQARVQVHNGRPLPVIDGVPVPVTSYSPRGGYRPAFEPLIDRFFQHDLSVYFLGMPPAVKTGDYFATPFWVGDQISSEPLTEIDLSLAEQARYILERDPDAHLVLRYFTHEPASWRKLHRDELFVTEEGQTLPIPSLASDLYWEAAARYCQAVIEHCESQPFASRLIGYANFHRVEGTHEPLIEQWLFDHGPRMTAAWRQFLRDRYKTDQALQLAHNDPSLTLDTVPVPRDRLRGSVAQVSQLLYWQSARDNAPLRDYLLLNRDLFHKGYRKIAAASAQATSRQRIFTYDALKQTMLGWSNWGFFHDKLSWPIYFPETTAGSGAIGGVDLLDIPGSDGLITPHDYQVRGVGGIFEPEGSVDSAVLRGKLFLAEMDQRTFTGNDRRDYGAAQDMQAFKAITWRNVATALTRGFQFYWMDLSTDWFATPEIHEVIAKQVAVVKQSVAWLHADVPGIAMILDDSAILETNGSGHVLNETVMWEQRMGLARAGVPYRIYQFEDLALPNFPQHAVYYFPNLYRVDDARMALLQEKVLRDGNVVVWGPGSGISDGVQISAQSATRLTGFDFEFWPINYPRRTLISHFDHPLTRNLSADTVIGGPLAFGPLLYPKDGLSLGAAWTKQGRNYSGLAVKSIGRGARSEQPASAAPLGPGDWASVFTTATPLPADLWRNLARFGGAHVYCQTNDILLADASIVALHSLQGGPKRIDLPQPSRVFNVITGDDLGVLSQIEFNLEAPGTAVYRLGPVD